MAKFKKGDRVRCVKPDDFMGKFFVVGDIATVSANFSSDDIFQIEGGGLMETDRWELVTPSPIPDTVTIGGVEYVRKPEPEHVWAWGQWARVKGEGVTYDGNIVFITGGIDDSGFVPITCEEAVGEGNSDGVRPKWLTYLGTATIPE